MYSSNINTQLISNIVQIWDCVIDGNQHTLKKNDKEPHKYIFNEIVKLDLKCKATSFTILVVLLHTV